MKYYAESTEKALLETKSGKDGLSSAEASERLLKNGKNKLVEAKKESLFVRFLKQLADPMIIILLAAAAVSGVIAFLEGESFTDVIIILAVVLFNAILGVYQESKAEKAIEALQEMAAATSKVIRDGKIVSVKSEELVVGDVILLEAGDAVPADARLIESAGLKIEESALTGESVPVNKMIDAIYLKDSSDIPLGDRANMVYMGSTVVYGRGTAVVTACGMDTEMGKIADAISKTEEGKTPLQMKLSALSKTLTWVVLGICVVIFGVQIIKAGSFTLDVALDSFMVAVSLAVAAIPEGLAAVVTVVLSIGVSNMSKRSAIVRRLTAVETLGCAQIICSDKTGTLTQNKMTVVDFFGEDEKLIACAMSLSSDAELNSDGTVTGEPTEAALIEWAKKLGINKNDLKESFVRVGEVPFDSDRKMMTCVCRTDKGFIQYTKGAPDVVIDRCTHRLENGKAVPMTDEYKKKLLSVNKGMADRALRVLAVALVHRDSEPSEYTSEALEKEMCFAGLSAMIDPVRPEVKAAIVECRSAGITPIMITGDHVDTAVAIAKELGILDGGKQALTGAGLSEMSDEEFEKCFRNISVYARVQPEHKTRIVNAWKKAGFITAMTGDGVNDAPSIKASDIGVGMGITGTDVTKNVADMVLADDNFATIVGAVEEGRRIYDNIKKAIQFLLGSNVSEVIAIFIATLCGFVILKPVHLLWINLITDSLPALALGMEKAEPDIMKRAPRSAKEGVFSDGVAFDVVYQGLSVALLVLASYFIGVRIELGRFAFQNSDLATTMAFITLSMAEIFHSFNMRSRIKSIFAVKGQNKVLWGAALLAVVSTALVCEVPFIAAAFGFTAISIPQYLIAVGIGFCIIPIVEIVKTAKRIAKR